MPKPDYYSFEEQREALRSFRTPGFLASPAGSSLLEQLRHFVAPALISLAREDGYRLEADAAVNVVVLRLLEDDYQLTRTAGAVRPWGYLVKSATRWVRAESVQGSPSLDEHESWEHHGGVPSAERQTFETHPKVADEIRIAAISAAVSRILETRTPECHRQDVSELVEWLCWNPQTRFSYETQERERIAREFPTVPEALITAVTNAAWGGRARRIQTSLIGAVIQDISFRPSDSPTISRSLVQYRRAMRSVPVTINAVGVTA